MKILIDPKAVLFLLGTEMDWKVGKLSSQFVFNNPNQTSACGCGESVLLTPAKPKAPRRTSALPSALERTVAAHDPRLSSSCFPHSGRSPCAACSAARGSSPTD